MLRPGLGCAAVDTASMALSASLYGGTPFLGTAMGIQACSLPQPLLFVVSLVPQPCYALLLGSCMLPGQAQARLHLSTESFTARTIVAEDP
jgi:hypothetical protein